MSVTVRLATPLRAAAGGNATLTFDAADLGALARAIADRYPELAERVLRDGAFGRFVNVFVDGEDVRFLGPDGDLRGKRTVEILPAMSGGAVAPLPERRLHEVFGSFIDETIGIVARQTRDTVSFAVGSPSREALDMVGADDLVATVIRREGAKALGYGVTEGEPELRDVIASAARDRAVAAETSHVLVSAGALQAVDLACRVYLRPGDVVVAESPAFANALSAFRNHGARVLEVPVDGEGLDVAEASRRIRKLGLRPRMFFVVPNFQNPTGETLSLERREALLALAASHDAVVIEDDPYGALRYRGDDLPPLAALGGAEVVSIGTFSKTFLPGLRVGWVIAHNEVIARMARAKQTMDSSTGTLAQRIVLEFHRRGGVAAHVGRLRALYGEKQERARAALSRELGGTGVSWNDPAGGFYFWVRLPRHVSARALLDVALDEGVAFVPGDAFAIDADHSSSLRFSISAPPPHRVAEGVRRLRRGFARIP